MSKHSKVMIIANRLVTQGIGRSAAMIKAWVLVRLPLVDTKVAGVTHGRRQTALEHLEQYPAELVSVQLRRDAGNTADRNAVAVVATVESKGSYIMGYLPRPLAALVAPLMDTGKAVQAAYKGVTGGFGQYSFRGLRVAIAV